MKHAVLRTSMNMNTNVGPPHGFGDPPTPRLPSESFHGSKLPMDSRKVRPFYTGPNAGGSSRTPTSIVFRGSDVDDNSDISKRRHLKQFVKTKIGGNVQYGLCNLTLEFEKEVSMNYGDEEQVLGDHEMNDTDGVDHEEAPYDGDAVMPSVVTSNVGIPGFVLTPRRHSRAFQ
jgi:hypothetical protein